MCNCLSGFVVPIPTIESAAPLISNLPNEPVEVDEPDIFPAASKYICVIPFYINSNLPGSVAPGS